MTTRQIRLRAMEPEDLDLLYHIENDHRLWNVGNTNVPYSRYLLHEYIAQATGDIYADRQVRLVIENEEGLTIGLADLMNFDAKNCRAEVGLVIITQHRCQGYGQLAVAEILHYALHVLHLHQLYAVIDAGNDGALRLFGKMGFSGTSTLPEWLYDGKKYHDAVLMQIIF